MYLTTIILLLFITTISGVELLLRVHRALNKKKSYYKNIRTEHELLGWIHIPSLSTEIKGKEWSVKLITNSLGFRDEEHYIEKKNNVIRILLLGDSFVAAIRVPYEKTFHQVMRRELEKSLNANIETINLAVGGWTTANEYLAFKEIGVKYKPDIVILVIYIHNDIYENSLRLKGGGKWSWPVFEIREGELALVPKEVAINYRVHKRKGLLKKLFGRFLLFRILYRKILKRGSYPSLFDVYLCEYPEEWLKAFEITKKLILKIKELAESIGAYFLVVIAPSPWQVESERWLKVLKEYPSMQRKKWCLENPDRVLIDFFKKNKFDYLWLLPYLRHVTNKDKKLYFRTIDHWNEIGERIVGLILADKLKSIILQRINRVR
ncbi:MAG: hypothetical protein B6U76_06225 [Desulfurococcales archaeon ex4484_217_2]|nr:MAG: hypothetical protein B6U76_06225 [Desulfurococcales archaeon ex4484_217_2]